MSPANIATVVKMLESLPKVAQDRVIEHLREYIESMRDELQWDDSFNKSHLKLAEAARRARQEIAEGHAEPMDFDQL